jgi:hypothetical protein
MTQGFIECTTDVLLPALDCQMRNCFVGCWRSFVEKYVKRWSIVRESLAQRLKVTEAVGCHWCFEQYIACNHEFPACTGGIGNDNCDLVSLELFLGVGQVSPFSSWGGAEDETKTNLYGDLPFGGDADG